MPFANLLNMVVDVYAKQDTGALVEQFQLVASGKPIRIMPLGSNEALPESLQFDLSPTDVGYTLIDSAFQEGRRLTDGTTWWQIVARPLDEAGAHHHYKLYLARV